MPDEDQKDEQDAKPTEESQSADGEQDAKPTEDSQSADEPEQDQS